MRFLENILYLIFFSIFYLAITFGGIRLLNKSSKKKEIYLFSMIMMISFLITILNILKIEIPSPTEFEKEVFTKLIR